jgi:hydroxymethylbilane synthase
MHLKLGTRSSALALVQSEWVKAQIIAQHPSVEIELVKIVTAGDKSQSENTPLSTYSDKGIFAKEIELALLIGEIDLAVHSMKDLAATLPIGLAIGAIPKREDVRDVVIGAKLDQLPQGARVGTGSSRRRALLSNMRPDLNLLEIRGNIDTRLRKLADGEYDAIILAAAGLNRLGKQDVIAEYLDPQTFIPDPGQGALAIEIRDGDPKVLDYVLSLDHSVDHVCVEAERAFLTALDAGCSTPVGAWARVPDESPSSVIFTAMRLDRKGKIKRTEINGSLQNAGNLGNRAAKMLDTD